MILDLILGGGWKILLAIVGAIGAALLWTNRTQEGGREERTAQEMRGGQARRKTDEAVARLPDDARTDELRRWER